MDVLNHEALPAFAQDGAGEQILVTVDAEQAMLDTAVPDVVPGGFHQPFFNVGVPGAKASNEKQVIENIDVMVHRGSRNLQAAREGARVHRFALKVGEHGPEYPQSGRGHLESDLGNVTFEVGGDQIFNPVHSRLINLWLYNDLN